MADSENGKEERKRKQDSIVQSYAFSFGSSALPGVPLVGRINSPAKPDADTGFNFCSEEFVRMVNVEPHKITLLLEHDADRPIGRVLSIWVGETDNHLWATVIIDDSTRLGAQAIKGIERGFYNGLSIGNWWNTEFYKVSTSVCKLALHEISLVKEPDDPTAVIVRMADSPERKQKLNYSLWEDILKDLSNIYSKKGEEIPHEVVKFAFENQHLGPVVQILALLSR